MLRTAVSLQFALLVSCHDGLHASSPGKDADAAGGAKGDAAQVVFDAKVEDARTPFDQGVRDGAVSDGQTAVDSSRPDATRPDATGPLPACSPSDSNNEVFVGARCIAGAAVAAACFDTKMCTAELLSEGFPAQGPFHCTKLCVADADCGTGLRCCRPSNSDKRYCVLPGCGVDCE